MSTPADTTESIEPTPERSGATTSRLQRVATLVLAVLAVVATATGLVLEIRHATETRQRDRDQRLLGFAMEAAATLVSTSKEDPNGYVDKVLAQATGEWRAEFESRRRAVVETMSASAGSTTGQAVAAGIERRDDEGTVTVLVAVSAQTAGDRALPPDHPPAESPTQARPLHYQLRVEVTEVAGRFTLSKVGFAQ